MLHARVIHPPALGATLISVDESSDRVHQGARVVRIQSFLAVVAEREWNAIRGRAGSAGQVVAGHGAARLHQGVRVHAGRAASCATRRSPKRGDLSALNAPPAGTQLLGASYRWPIQTHGSIGPSCGVADVRADSITVWSSVAEHPRLPVHVRAHARRRARSRPRDLPGRLRLLRPERRRRRARPRRPLLSKATGRPGARAVDAAGGAWSRPRRAPPSSWSCARPWTATARSRRGRRRRGFPWPPPIFPTCPLLSLDAAGIPQTPGRSTGLIYQNVDPPYAMPNLNAVVHWIPDAPLRTSAIRAPGKVANTFAVESFVDEIAAVAKADPVEFRLRRLTNPRAVEVLQRVATRMGWQPRPSPRPATRRRRSSPAAASPSSTTSRKRRWWPWAWRWRWSAPPARSA